MLLKPTNDFVFKKLFGEPKNQALLQDLVEGIFPDLAIKTVEVQKDVSLTRKIITEKLGILDVVATLNDNIKINIEMQVKDYYNTVERSLFYATGMFHEGLENGEDYITTPQTISIWITTYDIFEDGPFHEIALLKRDYQNKVLTDKFALHYIQLPKFQKQCKTISNKLDEWLTFIINENPEAIDMIENQNIKKAKKELEYLTGDEETRRLAELREKAIRDEQAALKKATREGEARGRVEAQKEIARNMKVKGIELNVICEITGLSREEIEKLK